jgi:hypothetical protein
MKEKLYIGITSYATEGKDTSCQILLDKLLAQGVKAKRRALADSLKTELRPYILKNYDIDILNCTPSQKESIRQEMVDFGKKYRKESQGTHWTNKLDQIVVEWDADVIIVPDLRYDYYEKDEKYWIKNKPKGILLAVTRYEVIDGQKHYVQPPNEDERENGPKMKAAADFSLVWETLPTEELVVRYKSFFDNLVSFAIQKLY